jgi:DNA-binding transcriptional LysR family regulator
MASMIDRYLLRYFLGVVDHGNFSRAARAAEVSQPTLSSGIAKLERLVGAPVFERDSRRVELTPAGTRLLTHARRIEAEFAEVERAGADTAPARLIRIGIAPSIPAAMVERAVAAARIAAPDERLELVEGTRRDLIARLDRRRLDAVVAPAEGDFTGELLFEEGYAVAMASAHRLAGRERVTAEEIAGETMLVRRHCEALAAVSRHFTDRGVRPFFAARTTNDEWALAHVRAGLGITVMPRCFAGPGVAIADLAGFDRRRRVAMMVDAAGGRAAASGSYAAMREALRGRRGVA